MTQTLSEEGFGDLGFFERRGRDLVKKSEWVDGLRQVPFHVSKFIYL